MIKDPAVLFTNIYTSLTYGIYYSFFECFPLVYLTIYGFNLGETGLCFLTIGIACVFGIIIFFTYQYCYFLPRIQGLRAPEHRLAPALFAVVTLSAGYYMFGFTVRKEIHWIVNLIAVTILITSNFLIFQSVFVYLPMSYPKYAASLFATNDLCRSLFAVACILFARPMFLNLGFDDKFRRKRLKARAIILSPKFSCSTQFRAVHRQYTPMRQILAQQSDELCYDSLRALAYGTFSRDHQLDGLKRTARRIYGKTLQQLQSTLMTASKRELATLIKPISIMGSYAIAVDSDLRFVHNNGLAQILEYCGPEHFQEL
ncbi:hypothetical protein MKX08_007105 [Trichoderma sp. CBMAI-0020]|nr:hypothetical protein MKX08_007105 [Trichoderma sp. CBMAI-0020]